MDTDAFSPEPLFSFLLDVYVLPRSDELARRTSVQTMFPYHNVQSLNQLVDSDMSKSTNTVVYFDWKTVIYIYACGKGRTKFMLPMEKSVTFTGACANDIIPNE
jgi:hypothetical protein